MFRTHRKVRVIEVSTENGELYEVVFYDVETREQFKRLTTDEKEIAKAQEWLTENYVAEMVTGVYTAAL